MMNRTCAQVESALPALALDALDPSERAEVLAHVAGCEACRAVLADYARLADGLLLSVPRRAPPPALRQRLLRLAGAESRPQRVGRRVPIWAWKLAVAVLAVACVMLAAQVARLTDEREALARRVTEQQQALLTLVGGNVRVVALSGRPPAAGATGSLRFTPDSTVALFEARDLPPLPPSQAYQLWLIYPDGTRDSGAVFSVPPTGETTLVVVAQQPLGSYARFGVSIEPAGGSPAPTGPPALSSAAS